MTLLCAREHHRRGLVGHTAVMIGCAMVAVSPVSWTDHQVWTVLAGLLLVAGPRRAHVVAGVLVLVTMTLSTAVLVPLAYAGPVGVFLRDNIRALCAVTVCCGGAVFLRQALACRSPPPLSGRIRHDAGIDPGTRPVGQHLGCLPPVASAGTVGV